MPRTRKPPRWSQWLLRRFASVDKRSIAGDLAEDYQLISDQRGVPAALVWYVAQVFILVSTYGFHSVYWRLIMFRSYWKIALRNIRRHKGYSFINMFGLTTGMAVAIMTFLYVRSELSFDAYHENSGRLHQVFQTIYLETGDITVENTYGPLCPDLSSRYPEIAGWTRLFQTGEVVLQRGEDKFLEENGGFAEPSMFSMFTFAFIRGDARSALADPRSIVLTESLAFKYFGEEDPMGRVMRFNTGHDLKVTAVVEDIPYHSHMQYTFFIPMEAMEDLGFGPVMDEYGRSSFYNYLLLREQADADALSQKIYDTFQIPNEDLTLEVKFFLVPITQTHLIGSQGLARLLLFIVAGVALLVLLTACINFMNLATARSIHRMKEVGIRKVIGGRRKQLVRQFMSESIIQTSLAFFLALLIVAGFLPFFNSMAESQLRLDFLKGSTLLGFFGIFLVTGFVAGSYPALFLSAFPPVRNLQRGARAGKGAGRLRKILVVVQFFFSVILIVCTMVSIRQFRFLENADIGFDDGRLLYTRGDRWGDVEPVKAELLQNPNIVSVTTARFVPSDISNMTPAWGMENVLNGILAGQSAVGYDYVETFGMELAEGRFYSKEISTDATDAIVINETAVRQMGLEEPIGQRMYYQQEPYTIIGVMKDFQSHILKLGIGPVILPLSPGGERFLFVKYTGEEDSDARAHLGNVLQRFNPDYPVDVQFLEDYFQDGRDTMKLINRVMLFLTFLGIFISCLGLFGLASFTSEQRTKEIGIRKTLGATASGVVLLLSKDFIKLLIMSNLFALPLAYLAMKTLLQNFASPIRLGIGIFIITGGIVFSVAFLSVGYRAVRSAVANPVDSLRYE